MEVTQEQVNESLDNAIDNGYDDLLDWDASALADDLHEYDAQFEDLEPSFLTPFIQVWKDSKLSP